MDFAVHAVKSDPASSDFYVMLGACYCDRQEYKSSESAFLKAIHLQPKNHFAHLCLGLVYRRMRRQFDKALKAYDDAIALAPLDSGSRLGIGGVYYDKRDRDNAVKSFTSAVELDGSSAQARFGLAKTYHIFGGLDAALIHFEAGLKIEPNNAEAHAGLATIYAAKHDQDASLREYVEAYRLDPGSKEIRKRFAQALLLTARVKDAVRVKSGLPLGK